GEEGDLFEGDELRPEVTIKNLGYDIAEAYRSVLELEYVVFGRGDIVDLPIDPIFQNQEVVLTDLPSFTIDEAGEHKVSFAVDPQNRIYEIDTYNNEFIKDLVIKESLDKKPDLRAANVRAVRRANGEEVSLDNIEVNDEVEFKVEVENIGEGDAPLGYYLFLSTTDGGNEVEAEADFNQDVGSNSSIEVTIPLDSLQYTVIQETQAVFEIRARPTFQDREENKENNSISQNIKVVEEKFFDLEIGDIQAVRKSDGAQINFNDILIGEEIQFEVEIRNLGSGKVESGSFLTLNYEDQSKELTILREIASQGNERIVIPAEFISFNEPRENLAVVFEIKPPLLAIEENTINNSKEIRITVSEASVGCADEGEEVYLNASAGEPSQCCSSDLEIIPSISSMLSIGDDCYSTNLSVRSSKGICINKGDDLCQQYENPCNSQADCQGGQNADYATKEEFCASDAYANFCNAPQPPQDLCSLCERLPDFVITDVKAVSERSNSETDIKVNDQVVIKATVKNVGSSDSAPTNLQLSIQADSVEKLADIPALSVNQEVVIETDSLMFSEPKTVTVQILADSTQTVDEIDENNNVYEKSFSVEGEILKNEKLLDRYSSKELFLISDKDWKAALSFVPVAVWTDGSQVNKYPYLIFHDDTLSMTQNSYDVDSIIYFINQYNPDKITVIGTIPDSLSNRLSLTIDAELSQIDPKESLNYWDWSTLKDIVLVKNYEDALMASTYASLINAPLVVQGQGSDIYNVLNSGNYSLYQRNFICVGGASLDSVSCNENYSLAQLQQKYVDLTDTDKMILVNPRDYGELKVNELYETEMAGEIKDVYSRNSINAPILASTKHEVIIETQELDYAKTDEFIENEIARLGLLDQLEYLTIIGSPNAIDMNFEAPDYPVGGIQLSADALYYARLGVPDDYYLSLQEYVAKNGNFDSYNIDEWFLDLAVGRIFGVSNSDTSANIARSLFYEESLQDQGNVLATRGAKFGSAASRTYMLGKVFESLAYTGENLTVTPQGTKPQDWENKFLILYEDHGTPTEALGVRSEDVFYLNNTFLSLQACSTCNSRIPLSDFYKDHPEIDVFRSETFCANMIRKGAVGGIFAVDIANSGYEQRAVLSSLFDGNNENDIGNVFKTWKNAHLASDFDTTDFLDYPRNISKPRYTLLGDPTLKIKSYRQRLPKFSLDLIKESGANEVYKLSLPVMRVDIPSNIQQLNEYPQASASEGPYFVLPSQAYNISYELSSKLTQKFALRVNIDDLGGKVPARASINFGSDVYDGKYDIKIFRENDDYVWLFFPSIKKQEESGGDHVARYFEDIWPCNENQICGFENYELQIVVQ
ncbi:MAG: hypothetical protein GF347_01940, partial [Candidatus Moranbacteria bacterium]|nr:hypothetical protein [Candidatus Moranbacteria bacterium]